MFLFNIITLHGPLIIIYVYFEQIELNYVSLFNSTKLYFNNHCCSSK